MSSLNWKVGWWKACANPACRKEFLDKNQRGRTLCKACSDYMRNHCRLPKRDEIMLTGVHHRRVRAPDNGEPRPVGSPPSNGLGIARAPRPSHDNQGA